MLSKQTPLHSSHFVPGRELPLQKEKESARALFAARYTNAAEIHALIAGLVNSAPGVLDTLGELATALGDDPNFAATMTAALAGKLTEAQADARYYTQSQVDALVAGNSASISSVGGSGTSILENANTVRRITGADNIAVTQAFDVANGLRKPQRYSK